MYASNFFFIRNTEIFLVVGGAHKTRPIISEAKEN